MVTSDYAKRQMSCHPLLLFPRGSGTQSHFRPAWQMDSYA